MSQKSDIIIVLLKFAERLNMGEIFFFQNSKPMHILQLKQTS